MRRWRGEERSYIRIEEEEVLAGRRVRGGKEERKVKESEVKRRKRRSRRVSQTQQVSLFSCLHSIPGRSCSCGTGCLTLENWPSKSWWGNLLFAAANTPLSSAFFFRGSLIHPFIHSGRWSASLFKSECVSVGVLSSLPQLVWFLRLCPRTIYLSFPLQPCPRCLPVALHTCASSLSLSVFSPLFT